MPRQVLDTNSYSERLLKLVPAEWVSAYVAIKGLLDSDTGAASSSYFWVIGIQVLVLPLYLRFALNIQSWSQTWVTCVSFLIWVFSLGGQQFGTLDWYKAYYGSIALILWTSAIPIWKCGRTDFRGEPKM